MDDFLTSTEEHLVAHSEDGKWSEFRELVITYRGKFESLKQSMEEVKNSQKLLYLIPLMDEMFKIKHEFREHPEYLRFLAHKEEISLLLKPLMSSSSSRLPIENVSKLVAEAILQKEKQVQEEIERRLKEQEESLTQTLVSQMTEEHTKTLAELTAEGAQEIERIKLQLETAAASMGILEEENKQMQQRIEDMQEELKGY